MGARTVLESRFSDWFQPDSFSRDSIPDVVCTGIQLHPCQLVTPSLRSVREGGKYDLDFKTDNNDGSKVITGEALADMYRDWAKRYPIVSVEDPFDQDDWESWTKYTASVPHQVVGDDLTVTTPKRIQMAIDKKACNCLLLKVNQVC